MRLQRHDLTFPRLDLPASHMTAMTLSASLDVPLERDLPDDGMFELFMDPTVSFYTAMAYRKSGMTHFVSAQLGDAIFDPLEDPFSVSPGSPLGVPLDDALADVALADDALALDDDGLQIEIAYAIDPTHTLPKPPGTLNNEANLLRWLADDPTPKDWTCIVTFEHEVTPETAVPPWFPLPHEIAGESPGGSPLTEIRGIRGVKLANDDRSQPGAVEYSVVCDRAELNRLVAVVEFSVSAPCSSQVPAMVMDRGHAISQSLKLPRP